MWLLDVITFALVCSVWRQVDALNTNMLRLIQVLEGWSEQQ